MKSVGGEGGGRQDIDNDTAVSSVSLASSLSSFPAAASFKSSAEVQRRLLQTLFVVEN